ncbi:MAG TPA: ABC transporter substrate-binding protein [Candidatus Binatia bacterium]|nr:ABC transporter substrate-binding protein [Candidatus Binatia bacterium]
MHQRQAAFAFVASLVLSVVVPAHGDAPAPVSITVTFVPVADAVPMKYAIGEGLFQKAGLDVKVDNVGSGALATIAVVGGAADIGSANTLSIVLARSKGVPLMLVAPQAQYDDRNPTTQLLVSADSPIKTPKDLEGRTVAVAGLHDLLALGVRAWMSTGGADPTKVRFIETIQSTMLAALDAKRVDAIMVSEPILTTCEASGRTRMLAGPYGSIAQRFVVDDFFASAAWLASHRDAALRFADVMRRATAYTNAHYDEMIPLIASYTSISLEVLRKMRQIKGAQALTPDQIQPIIEAAVKYGEIPSGLRAQEMIFTARTRF